MRKSSLAAIAASGLVVFGILFVPSLALAEEAEGTPKDSDSSIVEPTRPGHSETDRKHKDLEERYGKEGHLIVPPLVIRPENDAEQVEEDANGELVSSQKTSVNSGFVLTTPSAGITGESVNPTAGSLPAEVLTSFDPEQNLPVEIDSSKLAGKSPADMFIESATAGLAAMAIGAIALGAIAGTRAIRRK